MKFERFLFEPFLGTGYEGLDLDGDGDASLPLVGPLLDMDKARKEWFIEGGFSIRF